MYLRRQSSCRNYVLNTLNYTRLVWCSRLDMNSFLFLFLLRVYNSVKFGFCVVGIKVYYFMFTKLHRISRNMEFINMNCVLHDR